MKKILSTALAILGLALFSSCNDPAGNNPTPPPPVGEGLQLVASERYFKADGTASVKFTVMNKGVDVTSAAKIVQYKESGSVVLNAPEFKTNELGEYVFYAIHESVSSAKINVFAVTAFPELPVDAMPSKYDGFKKRVAGSQFTSNGCQFCPRLIKPMHDYLETADADNVVFIGCRFGFGDPFETAKAEEMARAYGSTSLPDFTFAMSKKKENRPTIISEVKHIKTNVDRILKDPARTLIAVATEVVDGKVCVRAEVKIAEQGNYNIGAMLVEDGLFAVQANSTGLKEDYFNTHNYCLRAAYPAKDGVLNEELGGKKVLAGNTKETFCCDFDITKAKVSKIENARVLVFIYDNTKAECDNIVSVKVGEKVAYQYL